MQNFLKKHKRLFVIIIALILLGFGVKSCFYKDTSVSYITQEVERKNIQNIVNASGQVRAIQLVTVGAQVSGKIEKLYVQVGQQIKEGDLIAEIDSTKQKNDVAINKAKIASYQAQADAAKITLAVAEKQYKRAQQLRKDNALSDEDLENAQNAFESAKAQVTQINANLQEAEISLDTAQTNLSYTRITAPQAGTVVSVPVKQGQTVNAAMNTPAIIQIADLSQMEILLEISEGDIAYVKTGMKVRYATLSNLDKTYETTLQSIDPGLTLLTNATYSEVVGANEAIYYYGRLIVPNEDNALRIGMTTQTEIFIEQAENVLSIPTTALKGDKEHPFVEVLTKEGSEKREIETGVSDGISIEVKKGLQENESVIIAQLSSGEISDKAANTHMRGPRF